MARFRPLSLIAPMLLALAPARVANAITFSDPGFTVPHTWAVSAIGLPNGTRPGGLVFSADGTKLYVVSTPDSNDSSAIYSVTVTRDAMGRVTALGTPTTKVIDGDTQLPGIDAGLEFGPGGNLFFGYLDSNFLVQRRVLSGVIQGTEKRYDMGDVGLPLGTSGIAFSPHRTDPATGFGVLQVSHYYGEGLYEVALAADPMATGFFRPTGLVRFVRVVGYDASGLQYVPAGTFAGDLLYARPEVGELRLVMMDAATGLAIDLDTGLPTFDTANPVDVVFASDLSGPAGTGGGPIGLEFDWPRTTDLFVSTLDGSPANSILHIRGFDPASTTTTSSTSTSTAPPTTTTSTTLATTTTTTSTSTTTATAAPTTTTSSTTSVPGSTTTTSTNAPTTTTTSTSSTSTTSTTTTTSSTTSVPGSTTTTSTNAPTTTTSTSTTTTAAPTTTTSSTSTTSTTGATTSSSTTTAPTTSSTSSTTSTAAPTTSTAPLPVTTTTTLPPGCPSGPSFASVGCRLVELRLAVEGAPELGDLQARLLGRVTHALGRQATAEERAGAGKRRGAKKQLAAALADLGGFRATLRSRKGRRLPADLRDRLESAASLLADEVKALRRSL